MVSGLQPCLLPAIRACSIIQTEVWDFRRRFIPDPRELAERIAQAASDKKASDIVVLDVRSVTIIADYFVICTGGTERQVRAIMAGVVEDLAEDGIDPLHAEGQPEAGWVVLDYGDVVVHVFGPEERKYYRLESVWSGAVPVLVIQ